MYLTGGTLGLALLLARSFSIALELIETTDELGALKKGSATNARSKLDIEELEKKIDTLQAENKKKDLDLSEFLFSLSLSLSPRPPPPPWSCFLRDEGDLDHST